MKKISQTIIATVIAMFTLFTPIRVFASDDTSDNLYEYIDSQGKTHTFFDVLGNQLSIYEVEELMKEKTENTVVPYGVVYPYRDKVLVNSYSVQYGTRRKMTPDVKGPATITYLTSITTTSTYTVNFGVDINTRIFKEVAIKFGVSYTQSSTSLTSFSPSFSVPSGKIGAVYFTPKLYTVTCTYVDNSGDLGAQRMLHFLQL